MRNNHWIVLAVAALAAMFFVPRAAYSFEVAVIAVPGIKAPVAPARLPSRIVILPTTPTMPVKPIPGPFEGGVPQIRLPDVRVPMLPFKINVAPVAQTALPAVSKRLTDAAQSERGVTTQDLDATFDARGTEEEGDVVVVGRRKDAKRKVNRLTLPESDLELEIGIIQ